MKRSRTLLGLPALTLMAACTSTPTTTARTPRNGCPAEVTRGPDTNVPETSQPVARTSTPARDVASTASVSSGDRVVARPLTDSSGRPAPGNVQGKGGSSRCAPATPAAETVSAQPAPTTESPEVAPAKTLLAPSATPASDTVAVGRPLINASGRPASGNVVGKSVEPSERATDPKTPTTAQAPTPASPATP